MKSIEEAIESLGLTGKKFSGVINKQIGKYNKLREQLSAVEAEYESLNEQEQEEYADFSNYVDEYYDGLYAKLEKIAKRESQKSASITPKAPKVKATPAEPAAEPAPAAEPTVEPRVETTTAEATPVVDENNTPEEEKKGGSGMASILIGGLVLLTTFGAYNYFKKR